MKMINKNNGRKIRIQTLEDRKILSKNYALGAGNSEYPTKIHIPNFIDRSEKRKNPVHFFGKTREVKNVI